MNALRSSIFLTALCSLFTSSLVYADDCSDALIAESCACRLPVRSDREKLRTSEKDSPSDRASKASKSAKPHIAHRAKGTHPPSDKAMPQSD